MKCIVIGAAGQVGLALMRTLRLKNHQTLGIDRLPLLSDITIADASDLKMIRSVVNKERPDWIFYPAGFSWVDGCERDSVQSYESNVEWPVAVARIADEYGAGFTYFSSEYVFDGRNGPYSEDSKPNPINVYGYHKHEAEQRLPLVAQTLIVRTTVVYGPEIQRKNFVCQVLDKLRTHTEMVVPIDQISSPTYNKDLADACVELAERRITGMLHLSGPNRIDRYSFALDICEVFDLDPTFLRGHPTEAGGQVAKRPLNAGLDSIRAYSLIETRFKGVREGLTEMRKTES